MDLVKPNQAGVKIHTIDQEFLGTPQAIASYLVEGPDGYLLIETGPASVKETLERKIGELGVDLHDIKDVLVTHIHLDHSGGAGYWAERGATIYVHPIGAPHLIDPSRLLSSAERIYLDRMDYLWGKTIAIPQAQVVEFVDSTRTIAGLSVEAIASPGHASHHLAFRIGEVLFTGDVAACRLPGSRFVSVPGPPPEFWMETWLESLQKLEALPVSKLYLTHFGEVEEPQAHFAQLRERLKDCTDFVFRNRNLEPQELAKAYQAWDREQAARWGVDDATYQAYEKANPSFMSAQGIARYWRKKLEV